MLQPPALLFVTLTLLMADGASEAGSRSCAESVSELASLIGEPSFPLKWEETTMSDGKPLVVSILERKGMLVLEFIKTREGLWAESTGIICRSGADLEIVFAREQVRLGPAASWIMQHTLGRGGTFTISRPAPNQLKISTGGWSGIFVPQR